MEHALRSVKKDVIIASREQASPLCHSLRRIDQLDMLKIVENMVYPFVEMGGGGRRCACRGVFRIVVSSICLVT